MIIFMKSDVQDMEYAVYQVRKEGAVYVETRDDAITLVYEAAKRGYTFGMARVHGFGFKVIDEDD